MRPPDIPDKVYFKIGEAAEIVGVEPHVLRFWETEFPQIKPNRASSKQRLYRRKDIIIFLEIKRLLYDEKYTIAGAKKQISAPEPAGKTPSRDADSAMREIKKGLLEIKRILEGRTDRLF